jgi:hypothetical protein
MFFEMPCRCRQPQLRRRGRHGFYERYILCYLGLFPWVCKLCSGGVKRFRRRDNQGAL